MASAIFNPGSYDKTTGMWNPSEGLAKTLQTYQSDAIDYLYDAEPQSNNLFFVGGFVEDDNQSTEQFYLAQYLIKSIEIQTVQHTYKIDPVTRLVNFDTVTLPRQVTIEWAEDVYHSVKKYHSDWMLRWYNRRFDVLRCGAQGKFRRCRVVAFHYINSTSKENCFIETPTIAPLFLIDITGMAPQSFGNYKFSHSDDGNDASVSISYNISDLNIRYSTTIGLKKDKEDMWKQEKVPDNPELQVWSPIKYYQRDGTDSDGSLEKLRVVRSATSNMPGEGML